MEKKKFSSEELIELYSQEEMTPLQKVGHSYVAIKKLIDFIQVLEKNEKDYRDEINIITCKITKIHPSDVLSHYILLEVCNFYETYSYLKKLNNSLPKIPSYYQNIKKIRNKIIGHRDTKEELPLAKDVFELIKELSIIASTEKIIKDLEDIFENHIKPLLQNKFTQ
ncbi:MAG: hypothetical protein KKF67_01445 [Nanoarchaeota archaeon]|nr:hypothetical protein [Nanoarchaeota archaeon]